MSSQPPMGGHLDIPQNGILYTNVLDLLKVTLPVSQWWLLIAGYTVHCTKIKNNQLNTVIGFSLCENRDK